MSKSTTTCESEDRILSMTTDSQKQYVDIKNQLLQPTLLSLYYLDGWNSGTKTASLHSKKVVGLNPSVGSSVCRPDRWRLNCLYV